MAQSGRAQAYSSTRCEEWLAAQLWAHPARSLFDRSGISHAYIMACERGLSRCASENLRGCFDSRVDNCTRCSSVRCHSFASHFSVRASVRFLGLQVTRSYVVVLVAHGHRWTLDDAVWHSRFLRGRVTTEIWLKHVDVA